MKAKKILIIRLSSFGDIIQTLPCVDLLANAGFQVEMLTKSAFLAPVQAHPQIQKIHIFETKSSTLWAELKKIKTLIQTEEYDYIYDAHNNLRSSLMLLYTYFLRLRLKWFKNKAKTFKRPKHRIKRFFLFNFRWDLFPLPFVSAESFITPAKDAGLINKNEELSHLAINTVYNDNIDSQSTFEYSQQNYICLAPSAAWALKRWPVSHFQQLIDSMPEHQFIVIGGPEDHFAHELKGKNLINLVGKLSWAQTGQALKHAQVLISADTGVLHWADYMGVPAIGILGPTAFGFPFRETSKVLYLNLPCSPCTKDGRGRCKIAETQKCLKDIQPLRVKQEILNFI